MLAKYNSIFSPTYNDDFFNNHVSRRYYGNDYACKPAANIIEKNDEFMIELAAAGWSKEDLHIHIEKDILTISADRNEDEQESQEQYSRREFNFSTFSRSFKLDERIDQERIHADYVNGILNVHLPLKEQEVQKGPRSIDIK